MLKWRKFKKTWASAKAKNSYKKKCILYNTFLPLILFITPQPWPHRPSFRSGRLLTNPCIESVVTVLIYTSYLYGVFDNIIKRTISPSQDDVVRPWFSYPTCLPAISILPTIILLQYFTVYAVEGCTPLHPLLALLLLHCKLLPWEEDHVDQVD